MRVLHVIPSLSPLDGGPTHAMLAMERALTAAGVEVEIAFSDRAGPRSDAAADGLAKRWRFPRSTEFYKTAPAFLPWLRANVRRFDLVHVHALFSFMPVAAARAALRAGVPYVMRPLGTLDSWGMRARRPRLKGLSLRWIERPLLESAAAVHFTSEAEAAQARGLGLRLKEAVIPLGVDLPTATSRASLSATPVALYLSRLAPKKNLEGLLEALAQVDPALRLDIAGDGAADYVAALQARAQALGVASRVRWLGRVEGQAKAAAFAAADFFVLPSFSENFGIAAAEALASGLPCVLGEGVAIAKDVTQAGAGLSTATDPASIATALRLMIINAESRAAMSQRAAELARSQYSLEVMGRHLAILYSSLLRADGSSGQSQRASAKAS